MGSHDNIIYIYNCPSYDRHAILRGHNSFITAFDWSWDSQYIRSVCGAYELLFFNAKTGKHLPSGASDTIYVEWDSHSVKLGWNVEGIYPIGVDGTHINSVDHCRTHELIATGDDYGLVNVYRNPVRTFDHQSRSYRGHSEHVTRVAFAKDGEYLFSVGGMDQTVIQWKKISEPNND